MALTPTTTLTLRGAGVRGGVRAAVYPAPRADTTARPLYVELLRRF